MILVTTTPSVDGYTITNYQGIVFGEVVSGVNMFKDLGAGLRNMFGGRSQGYEEELMRARNEAIAEMQQRAEAMGAHAVAGVPDDRAQVKHLVELEPAWNRIRLAQRKAHSAGDIRGTSARDKNGRSRAHCGSRP